MAHVSQDHDARACLQRTWSLRQRLDPADACSCACETACRRPPWADFAISPAAAVPDHGRGADGHREQPAADVHRFGLGAQTTTCSCPRNSSGRLFEQRMFVRSNSRLQAQLLCGGSRCMAGGGRGAGLHAEAGDDHCAAQHRVAGHRAAAVHRALRWQVRCSSGRCLPLQQQNAIYSSSHLCVALPPYPDEPQTSCLDITLPRRSRGCGLVTSRSSGS